MGPEPNFSGLYGSVGCDFIDNDGVRHACFQLVRHNRAVAVIDFTAGVVMRFLTTKALEDRRKPIERLARIHLAKSIPADYSIGNKP